GYDLNSEEVFIPNKEISKEYVTAMKRGYGEVVSAVKASDELLSATWQEDAEVVAAGIEAAHRETSHLTYNSETALSYTISLAYYAAREYYTITREQPAGKGFADLVFVPRPNHPDKPAMIVELKWDKSAQTAIGQIKEKQYPKALEGYRGDLLLVGVNYSKKTKKHECLIECVQLS
ncbi:MAG: PD-(D/E)XK nuclease domain-containing protein, partial [Clostridiales Family XIII bacterium]|nr:PD-(D/E)XK nuclease domain-containing protein [Clostridiales Family XIII bacterium]